MQKPTAEKQAGDRSSGRGRVRMRVVLPGLAALLIAAWMAGGERILDWGIRHALREGARAAGLEFVDAKISGGIGRAIVISDVRFGPPPLAPPESATRLSVRRIEIGFESLRRLLFERDRLVARLRIEGVDGVLDLRAASAPPAVGGPAAPPDPPPIALDPLLFLPSRIDLTLTSFEILGDDSRFELSGVRGEFAEGRTGGLAVWRIAFDHEHFSRELRNLSCRTAWKTGVVYLSGLELEPDIVLQDLRVDLLRKGGPGIAADGQLFGGWLRADLAVGEQDGAPGLEAVVWAGNVPIAPLVAALSIAPLTAAPDVADQAGGQIRQINLRFRGPAGEPLSGAASLRLDAGDLSWQGRSFDRLVVGAQLANHRFELAQFELVQRANRIAASGRALVPATGNWLETEWSATLDARIDDLGELVALVDPTLAETAGQLRLQGNVAAGPGARKGAVEFEGNRVRWRGQELGSLRGTAKLDGDSIEVGPLVWENEADGFEGSGQLRLAEPFVYAGTFTLHCRDLGPYVRMLPAASTGAIANLAGGVEIFWQGDGTRNAHSGAIALTVDNLRAGAFPEGLNGHFKGTYSPENLLLRECRLESGVFDLRWTLSAGRGGIFADLVRLSASGHDLLEGQVYVPWDPRPLLTGAPWTAGMLDRHSIYADLRSGELDLQELAGLFGQNSPVQGTGSVILQAAGPLASPRLDADLALARIRSTGEDPALLATLARFQLEARDGAAVVDGRIEMPALDPVVVSARFPFGFRIAEEQFEWIDPTGALEGKIRLPETDLARFRTLLPGVRRLAGTARGEIVLGRSVVNPSIDGLVSLTGGELDAGHQVPALRDFQLTCRFDGSGFRFENTGGTVGAGPFQIGGGGDFSDPANPVLDLRLTGQEVLLARDRRVRLRANFDLAVRGGPGGGSVSGTVGLVEGRFLQRLEITPLLQASQVDDQAPLLLPDLSGMVPDPLAAWSLDVHVNNATPFLVAGNIASGEIDPDLRLVGTLGDPRPTGVIRLVGLRAYLPFSVVTIPEGTVFLRAESPRVPQLDIRGYSELLDYDIQLLAFGPLDEKNLILRSDPPLPQESILLLLTAGLAPGMNTGAGFGEAAIGQGGLLLLKTFARQFEREGVDLDSLINRIQVVSVPPEVQGMRPVLRSQFRLTDHLGVMAERDGFGYLGGGVTYTLRFR